MNQNKDNQVDRCANWVLFLALQICESVSLPSKAALAWADLSFDGFNIFGMFGQLERGGAHLEMRRWESEQDGPQFSTV